ncbi:MAG: PAS domain-containing sensor histidine kinase [Alphaproteobacteria bacterium]|nr:PAS domain-containing sensor histidine kinase [Alphaproteobacteria bacterium]
MNRLHGWAVDSSLHRWLAYVLGAAAVAAGIATVSIMVGAFQSTLDVNVILNLVYLDGIILLLLGLVVAWRLVNVWQDRRSGQAGAGLHVRLVMLFGLVAVTPAILVAVFSVVFINYGLNNLLNQQVATTINQSRVVADAYLNEHRKNISADAFAIASDLNFNAPLMRSAPRRLSQILSQHAALKSLSEALVINGDGRIMARSEFSLSVRAYKIPGEVLEQANRGKITILSTDAEGRIRAIVRLESFVDAFLLVERFVDPKVVSHVKRIKDLVGRYQAIKKERSGIQISFVMIFVIVSVLLLLAAIWIGLTVATQLARPISSLITAATSVSEGDLDVRVDTTDSSDEINTLGLVFNTMTTQLSNSQQGLMDANRQIDERRRFTETVLAGVSAGVIGLDAEGHIHLPNRSASELLGTDLEASIGKKLDEAVPEMAGILVKIMQRAGQTHQEEIRVGRDGKFHTLMVSAATERLDNQVIGYVITFDDVTDLLSAQRKAAWSDVARRIAHEIKNPLTPIQLSAERLKRKYLKEIETDPETFSNCTDTIIRQVEDLHRMVDEFSSFARMPQLSLADENLSEICRQALSLEHNRHPEIEYTTDTPDEDVKLYCDHRQVSRALTNLLKNAAEAITGRQEELGDPAFTGKIDLGIQIRPFKSNENKEEGDIVTVTVRDNGRGLPEKDPETLTEPYVTTRTKGTGLGLAIVKKIMEDHNGQLTLANGNGEGGGAVVSLIFPPMEKLDSENEAPDPMKVATDLVGRKL